MKKKALRREIANMGVLYARQCRLVAKMEAENREVTRLLFRVAEDSCDVPLGEALMNARIYLGLYTPGPAAVLAKDLRVKR